MLPGIICLVQANSTSTENCKSHQDTEAIIYSIVYIYIFIRTHTTNSTLIHSSLLCLENFGCMFCLVVVAPAVAGIGVGVHADSLKSSTCAAAGRAGWHWPTPASSCEGTGVWWRRPWTAAPGRPGTLCFSISWLAVTFTALFEGHAPFGCSTSERPGSFDACAVMACSTLRFRHPRQLRQCNKDRLAAGRIAASC